MFGWESRSWPTLRRVQQRRLGWISRTGYDQCATLCCVVVLYCVGLGWVGLGCALVAVPILSHRKTQLWLVGVVCGFAQEYLARVNFLPDGRLTAQVENRNQDQLSLVRAVSCMRLGADCFLMRVRRVACPCSCVSIPPQALRLPC